MELAKYGLVTPNYNLVNDNTYKLEAVCQYFIVVDNVTKLAKLIQELNQEKLKYFVIGGGSNIILPKFYEGVIIKLAFNELTINETSVKVGASYALNKLANETVNLGLKGLEWATGIPGTVAGALIGNAGAHGGAIMDCLTQFEILENNEIKILQKNEIVYEEHQTNLKQNNIIIIGAEFTLTYDNREALVAIVQENTAKRLAAQPLEFPSAGSVFRNPPGGSAWKLIESARFKGYTIGGAKVSEKHANFIINHDSATSEDIINLIKQIQAAVLKMHGVNLILEQQIIN